jgi:hypothetical protein
MPDGVAASISSLPTSDDGHPLGRHLFERAVGRENVGVSAAKRAVRVIAGHRFGIAKIALVRVLGFHSSHLFMRLLALMDENHSGGRSGCKEKNELF